MRAATERAVFYIHVLHGMRERKEEKCKLRGISGILATAEWSTFSLTELDLILERTENRPRLCTLFPSFLLPVNPQRDYRDRYYYFFRFHLAFAPEASSWTSTFMRDAYASLLRFAHDEGSAVLEK